MFTVKYVCFLVFFKNISLYKSIRFRKISKIYTTQTLEYRLLFSNSCCSNKCCKNKIDIDRAATLKFCRHFFDSDNTTFTI